MRYLKLFENFHDIDSLCKEYKIRDYTINDDGTIHVDGDVWLHSRKLKSLPIKFGRVSGFFYSSYTLLTSLEGSPMVVGSYFDCRFNNLSSLKGGPEEVGGDFNCLYNKLTSLEGCPKVVGGCFDCSDNKITIIDCLPLIIEGSIHFTDNEIRDIKVEDKNYLFLGKCYLDGNPINDLFRYWEGDLKNFIIELEFEDFIRDEGESVDITRFEYALNGKEYNREDITNYKLIYKE